MSLGCTYNNEIRCKIEREREREREVRVIGLSSPLRAGSSHGKKVLQSSHPIQAKGME